MKIIFSLFLFIFHGCSSSELKSQPHTFDCQILPYAVILKVDRFTLKDAKDDAETVAKRIGLKDYDIVCREE